MCVISVYFIPCIGQHCYAFQLQGFTNWLHALQISELLACIKVGVLEKFVLF